MSDLLEGWLIRLRINRPGGRWDKRNADSHFVFETAKVGLGISSRPLRRGRERISDCFSDAYKLAVIRARYIVNGSFQKTEATGR